jgi:hypothetical protein
MRHLSALVALAACAVVYSWPLLWHFSTAIPGGPTDRDVATMVWNVGYVHHALASPAALLRTADVLAPFGADLRLHTYGLLQGVLVSPLVPVVGVVGAFNLMLVGTLLLNGLCIYLLIGLESGSRQAATVAAACFMLAAPILDQIDVGRPTFASLWIVALALVVMRRLLLQPRLLDGLLLGALLVAALLTDFQIALYTALWLLVYALWRLRPRHLPSLAVGAVGPGIVFGAVFLPALLSDAVPRPSLDDMREYSFRVADAVDPAVLQHFYGLEFAVAAILARRVSVWLVGGLMFLLLALGPYLQPTDLPLPFAALSAWPPLAQFRTPYRMAMPAALGLAVVLGVVLARVLGRWPASIRTTVCAALVLARLSLAVAFQPLATQTYPSYAMYDRLAAEPGPATLIEVPFGVRSGLERIGNGGEVLEYYQHVHGLRLLNGMVARLPAGVFDGYRAHPALLVLSGEPSSASTSDLRELLTWTDARYVLVHRAMLSAEQLGRVEALLQPLAIEAQEADLVLYRAP